MKEIQHHHQVNIIICKILLVYDQIVSEVRTFPSASAVLRPVFFSLEKFQPVEIQQTDVDPLQLFYS